MSAADDSPYAHPRLAVSRTLLSEEMWASERQQSLHATATTRPELIIML